jgi:hypothetical protein
MINAVDEVSVLSDMYVSVLCMLRMFADYMCLRVDLASLPSTHLRRLKLSSSVIM